MATLDMPPALAAALYLRDASGLKARTDFAVPPLEPRVNHDAALIPHVTEQAAEAWDLWWSGLLEARRPVGKIVAQVEGELGRAAAPFDLLISILPVTGVWGSRMRHDHVLISRAMSRQDTEFAAFLEPVIRELAA
jgi:hypothetical protein